MDGKGNAMSAISPTDLLSDQSLSRCPDHISSPFGLFYTHASRVQKFLDSAREELRAYFGDYDYTIMQVPGAPRTFTAYTKSDWMSGSKVKLPLYK